MWDVVTRFAVLTVAKWPSAVSPKQGSPTPVPLLVATLFPLTSIAHNLTTAQNHAGIIPCTGKYQIGGEEADTTWWCWRLVFFFCRLVLQRRTRETVDAACWDCERVVKPARYSWRRSSRPVSSFRAEACGTVGPHRRSPRWIRWAFIAQSDLSGRVHGSSCCLSFLSI